MTRPREGSSYEWQLIEALQAREWLGTGLGIDAGVRRLATKAPTAGVHEEVVSHEEIHAEDRLVYVGHHECSGKVKGRQLAQAETGHPHYITDDHN
ncbi:hypothetical protein O3P69_009185 [Scylla paramamosain]|uniref:Uncharacterized protein n=1 Tax=Scylla paramamosain TaxID=85552 RepID=A0AAW0TA61_SCYPA